MCDKEEKESSNKEEKKWNWNNTELEDEQHTILTVTAIKQLLMNRGESKYNLNGSKMDLITKLKQNYNVQFKKSLSDLTGKQLLVELKLRCLNYKFAKKDILIERLTSAQPTIRQKQLNETPESFAKQIPWQHTHFEELNIHYLEQLLINRGVAVKDINGDRSDLIKLLKEKHTVKFQQPFQYLSCLDLTAEFALYGRKSFPSMANILKAKLVKQLKATIQHRTKCRHWLYCSKLVSEHVCTPMMINHNEFLIATEIDLRSFNTVNNEWTILMNYRRDRHYHRAMNDAHIACLDINNKLIYIYDRHQNRINENRQQLFIINYETKTVIKVIPNISNEFNCDARLLFAHKQVHLIRGYSMVHKNNQHLIFDEKKEQFDICYTFTYTDKYVFMEDFYISCKNRMLLICEHSDGYYEYNMLSHEWTKFNIKIPYMNVLEGGIVGCAVTGNQQYAILMGLVNTCILDLSDMKLYQSGMIPVSQSPYSYESVVVHSKNEILKEELIAFGYIRYCFHSETIGENIFPPHYIIKMIQEYCSDEFLHVLERIRWRYCNHRKIRVNDIMNNMTPVIPNDSKKD